MNAPEVEEALKLERSMRHRLYELAENQRWVHHAVDLDSGELLTTPLDRPVAPLSRAERLSRLGPRFDAAVFDGPFYRLTPRRPYQASPEAWLETSKPTYYAAANADLIWWEPPRDLDIRRDFRGMRFSLALMAPERRALASISLSGHSFDDTVGHILLAGGRSIQSPVYIPIDRNFAAHAVDFTFLPRIDPDGEPSEVLIGLTGGIELLTFAGITVRAAPPVVDPVVVDPG